MLETYLGKGKAKNMVGVTGLESAFIVLLARQHLHASGIQMLARSSIEVRKQPLADCA